MSDEPNNRWETKLIEKVALAAVEEQRRARRWGIFFKSLVAIYFAIILWTAFDGGMGADGMQSGPHTAVVELNGVIEEGGDANADALIKGLRNAFKDKNTKGVILQINSPGGSPVQAGQVNDEIKKLRAQYPSKPIYAVVTDLCASGGYYVAVATNGIYADKASLVGSIGVRLDGFGFTGLIEKVGVERRLITAGEHKGFLDPFSPVVPSEEEHMKTVLASVHQQFIDVVKAGRGDRLKADANTFTGLIWNGEQSLKFGLIDGLGNTQSVATEIIGAEHLENFTPQPDLFDRFSNRIGTSVASHLGKILLQEKAVLQ